jgi:23S rRNA pseudouridine2605 synthase
VAEDRLQKVLAAAGVASRRASEELIAQGRVTVNGEVAEIGRKVDPQHDVVEVDGERINVDPDRVYVLLNKPQGVVTTADDPEGRPTVLDLVNLPQRLFPVGRLDQDTEGLLLLTNDGELAHALTHPSYEVERTYVALVPGPVRRRAVAELQGGVELEDGPARARRVRVLEEERGKALVEIVMTEGRKREVRRMFAAVGLTVERLARVAYGGVELGELRQGKWRFLTQAEVGALHAAIRGRAPAAGRRSSRRERAARAAGGNRVRQPGRGERR